MRFPIMRGVIDRRILLNYRVEPNVLAALLPSPFRPKVYQGYGMVGICLIRLRHIRPAFLPSWMGISSENAAHRTAVEWEENGIHHEGVYVRRRDTNSKLNSLVGGRLFPGIHNHAQFTVRETATHFEVALDSDDGDTSLAVVGDIAPALSTTSIFRSLEEASAFFQTGALGYSATPDPHTFQGLELRCQRWAVEPLDVQAARSSFFDDRKLFPEGSIHFDCALLMRGIEHEWHGKPDLCCATGSTSPQQRELIPAGK